MFSYRCRFKILRPYTLLTRSWQANQRIIDNCHGVNWYSHPLLERGLEIFDWSILQQYDIMIITSKFVAELVCSKLAGELDVLVVGKLSAQILRQNNKIKKITIFQSVAQVLQFLYHKKYSAKIAYLSGDIVTTEMPKFVDRYILYSTQYAYDLSLDLQQKIRDMKIGAIMLYSKNSAQLFIDLCRKANLLDSITNIVPIALSYKVSLVLQGYFNKILFCSRPEHQLMLELLYGLDI